MENMKTIPLTKIGKSKLKPCASNDKKSNIQPPTNLGFVMTRNSVSAPSAGIEPATKRLEGFRFGFMRADHPWAKV
jgi:hypothetical protein